MLQKIDKFIGKKKKIFFWIILAVAFLIISFGINETGETWDEIAYYNAGRQYISSIYHGRFKTENWNANKEHPPVAKYIYGAASAFSYRQEGEHFSAGRYASAVILSLAIAIAFYFALSLFSPLVGVLSALILMLAPSFVAYGRVLGMDSITTLMFMLVAVVFYRFANSKARARDYILPGVVFGIGFATRYNLILAATFLPLAIILFASWRKDWKKWVSLIAIPIISILTFYLIWPYLWADPINNFMTSFHHWGQVREWYLGQKNAYLPHSYYGVYYLVTTPVAILILALVGIFKPDYDKKKIYLLGLLLLPFLNSFSGFIQNGIRYILFVWIPLSIFAAIGFVYLLKIIKNRYAQVGFFVALLAYMMFNLANHYPYYLDYYSEFIGGSKGNYEKKLMLFGWWGEGGKKTVDWLNENIPENSTVWNNMKPEFVLNNLREDIKTVKETENPDYIVINTNYAWSIEFKVPEGYNVIHEEKSGGAPIVTIYAKNK